MTNSFALPRSLLVFGVLLPLAAFVGYLLASPTDFNSIAGIGLFVLVLALPLVLKHHHFLLVLSWNASVIVFFLPGMPSLWMLLGGTSLGLVVLNRVLDKERKILNVPSITWTLISLGVVVLITAQLTGGTGLRSLGGGVYGGKKYFYIWFAIIAYFGLSAQRIPLPKAQMFSGTFLLSGMTAVLSNLIYVAGPATWFLYAVFSVDGALSQAFEDFGSNPFSTRFSRIGGLSSAGLGAYLFIIMRYGVRGVLDLTKPWRFIVLFLIVSVTMFSGFRSTLVIYGLIFAVQFLLERLYRSRLFPLVAVGVVLAFLALIPFVQSLPLSIQRSLSILPLPISAIARADAQGSSEWRLQLWRALSPEIPHYLWCGKGFTASATDYYLAQESVRRGQSRDYELMILSGDYHNGPLSILIPFGIWGVLAFLAFIISALRVLYLNHQNGEPSLSKINTFLLSYFIAKLIFFVTVFGALHIDIATFVGIVGLSIALNGGALRGKREISSSQESPVNELKPA